MEQDLHYLYVHSFPTNLKLDDKTEFLVSFGAVSVHEVSQRSKKQALIAGFRSQEDCSFAASLLNQLTILGRPLHAFIWHKGKENSEDQVLNLAAPEQNISRLEKYEAQLSAISTHLGLSQSLPPHLKYRYPAPTPTCLSNIANAMVAVPKFYTQVCHLMNKMNLPPPFGAPVHYTKEVRETMIGMEKVHPQVQDGYQKFPGCNSLKDSSILRENNQKFSVAVEDSDASYSYLSHSVDENTSSASQNNAKKGTIEVQEDSENTAFELNQKQELVKRNVVAGTGEKESSFQDWDLICATCKRPYGRNYPDMEKRSLPVHESIYKGNLLTSNVSESSESELESDSELPLSSVLPSTLEKLKALKRPRTTKNVTLDSRKRAKLQLKTQDMLQNSDMPSSEKNNSLNSKPSIRESFKELKNLTLGKKLQLKIPDTLPRKNSNVDKVVTSVDSKSQKILGSSEAVESISQAPFSTAEPSSATFSASKTACIEDGFTGTGDNNMSTQHNTSKTYGGELHEPLPAFGKIQVKLSQKKPVRSHENLVSLEELENNRIKESEYPVVPVLAKYTPGQPSSRLYIKNLAKSVSAGHLQRIYDRFVVDYFRATASGQDDCPVDIRADDTKYNVRVMQEGRMKGQAFVTLPSVTVAEEARMLTNGFILLDKPMVVSFARVKPST